MVHALSEAHRVLRPRGIVADLRPDRDPAGRRGKQIIAEYVWGQGRAPAGVLHESGIYYPDYAASDRAVMTVLRQGLFFLRRSETFWLRTYFRNLRTLEQHLATEWTSTTLPDRTRETLRDVHRRHPEGWIVAADPFRLNILTKQARGR